MVTPCDELEAPSPVEGAVPGPLLSLLPRLHALVIGPGLGRAPAALQCAQSAAAAARAQGVPVVVDADGLFALHADGALAVDALAGYGGAVLTPNAVEVRRLCGAVPSGELGGVLDALRGAGGGGGGGAPVLCLKGASDRVVFHEAEDWRHALVSDPVGAPKRCGGQGDVLAGCIGTFLAWGRCAEAAGVGVGVGAGPLHGTASCVASACTLVRLASESAFAMHGRSMGPHDVLACVGPSFRRHVDGA